MKLAKYRKYSICTRWITTAFLLFVFCIQNTLGADIQDAVSHSKTKPHYKLHYRVLSFDVHLAIEGSHCVNQAGVVVGTVWFPPKAGDTSQLFQAFHWEKGKLSSLNISEKDLPSSSSVAINNRGQIAGTITVQPSEMNFHSWDHAFLWEHDKWQDLNTLLPDEVSYAKAINDKGEVAISAQVFSMVRVDAPEPDTQHPSYLVHKSKVIPLGNKEVVALNNKSQVLLAGEQGHYYLWDNGKTTEVGLRDNGTSSLCDMNDQLQMIGHGRKGAFLYENSHLTYLDMILGPPGESYAKSINISGQIVGYFDLPPRHRGIVWSHAFLWQNQKLYDLNRLISPKIGWIFEKAISINDRGQIVGSGKHWGKPSNFLMTPLN